MKIKPIRQFKCKDLKPGDILIKFNDQGWLNRIIENLQWYFGMSDNASATHAGIVYDQKHVIEVQETGVMADDLTKENKIYGYVVFRCNKPALAAGAAEFAKILADVTTEKKNIRYAMFQALRSVIGGTAKADDRKKLEERIENILTNEDNQFFCSQLVVFIYQFVAEQNGIKASEVFKLNDTLVAPSMLGAQLVDSKLFDEVGYLMPNER